MDHRTLVMADVAEGNVLAGTQEGKRAFARLVEQVADMGVGIVVLSFAGIGAATASFLREAIIPFRDFCVRRPDALAVTMRDVSPEVMDELRFLADRLRDAFMVCYEGPAASWSCMVVGDLDPKQRLAYDAISQHGQTTASTLCSSIHEKPRVTVTAWNNRLAALREKGLIVQVGSGKSKTFTAIVEVING